MVAVGDGARASVQAQLQSLGTNLIVVLPGATTSNGVRARLRLDFDPQRPDDALAIRKEVRAILTRKLYGPANRADRQRKPNWSTSIEGITAEYQNIREWPVTSGRAMTDEDDQTAAPVCCSARRWSNNLFGEQQNPVGAMVRVKNFPLRVIGVLSVKGQSQWGQDQDDIVLIPFETAERKVLGVSAPSTSVAVATATPTVENPYTACRPPIRSTARHRRGQPIRSAAENHRGRQPDLCAGQERGRGRCSDERDHANRCIGIIISSPARMTISRCAA